MGRVTILPQPKPPVCHGNPLLKPNAVLADEASPRDSPGSSCYEVLRSSRICLRGSILDEEEKLGVGK